LDEHLPILKVTELFSIELATFERNLLPLINYLGNEAIEDENWEEIRQLTGVDVKHEKGEDTTIMLKHIQGIDTDKYKSELEEISNKSIKQFKIKKQLSEMKEHLLELELTVENYGLQ